VLDPSDPPQKEEFLLQPPVSLQADHPRWFFPGGAIGIYNTQRRASLGLLLKVQDQGVKGYIPPQPQATVFQAFLL
jgi:hypothetical protein